MIIFSFDLYFCSAFRHVRESRVELFRIEMYRRRGDPVSTCLCKLPRCHPAADRHPDTLSVTACATAPSRPSIVCPPVAAYDRAFQAGLADEIQRLPPGAALERAMLDYARLRDQARACSRKPQIR